MTLKIKQGLRSGKMSKSREIVQPVEVIPSTACRNPKKENILQKNLKRHPVFVSLAFLSRTGKKIKPIKICRFNALLIGLILGGSIIYYFPGPFSTFYTSQGGVSVNLGIEEYSYTFIELPTNPIMETVSQILPPFPSDVLVGVQAKFDGRELSSESAGLRPYLVPSKKFFRLYGEVPNSSEGWKDILNDPEFNQINLKKELSRHPSYYRNQNITSGFQGGGGAGVLFPTKYSSYLLLLDASDFFDPDSQATGDSSGYFGVSLRFSRVTNLHTFGILLVFSGLLGIMALFANSLIRNRRSKILSPTEIDPHLDAPIKSEIFSWGKQIRVTLIHDLRLVWSPSTILVLLLISSFNITMLSQMSNAGRTFPGVLKYLVIYPGLILIPFGTYRMFYKLNLEYCGSILNSPKNPWIFYFSKIFSIFFGIFLPLLVSIYLSQAIIRPFLGEIPKNWAGRAITIERVVIGLILLAIGGLLYQSIIVVGIAISNERKRGFVFGFLIAVLWAIYAMFYGTQPGSPEILTFVNPGSVFPLIESSWINWSLVRFTILVQGVLIIALNFVSYKKLKIRLLSQEKIKVE